MTSRSETGGQTEGQTQADTAPWTIKAVPADTRRKAKEAADRQDVTMAVWLTEAVNQLADRQARDGIIPPGRPEADPPLVAIDLPGFAAALTATVAAVQASGGRVPKALGRDAVTMLRMQMGLPIVVKRRRTARQTIAGTGQTLIEGDV